MLFRSLVEVAVAYAEEAPALYEEAGIVVPAIDDASVADGQAPADMAGDAGGYGDSAPVEPMPIQVLEDQPAAEPAPAVEVNDFAPADAGVAVDDAGFAVAPEAPAGEFMPGPDPSVFPEDISPMGDEPTQAEDPGLQGDEADAQEPEA